MGKKISFGWSAFDFKSWLGNFNIDDALPIKIVENDVRASNVFVPPLLTPPPPQFFFMISYNRGKMSTSIQNPIYINFMSSYTL